MGDHGTQVRLKRQNQGRFNHPEKLILFFFKVKMKQDVGALTAVCHPIEKP